MTDMKMMVGRMSAVLLAGTCSFTAFAQGQSLSGTVKDASGEPLIGVSVKVKDGKAGAVTDFDGNFKLAGVKPGATLVFSYIGYRTREVRVENAKQPLSVTLEEDTKTLDEVVVIGYGTVQKRDLTGSVSSVKAEDLANVPVANVTEALSGKLAGVNITTTEGSPDADVKIRVRGGGSLSQDNSPLYIVDGFPVSSISDIAPSEIESIDVLKDASSTAIYGARADVYGGRAANGQADALMTRADRISLYNCRMVSYQDTWWVRNNQSDKWRGLNNRNYADSCWIEGKTDYLYGNGNLLVERSTFFNVGTSGNVMTAGAHFPGTAWGHIMRGCTVDGLPSANGTTFFGRPWQQEPVAVWIDTRCKVSLDPAGWMDMGVLPKVYGEYGTTDAEGNPVDTSRRKTTFAVGGKQVPYPGNIVLDAADAAKYTYDAIITADDGWDPRSYYTDKHLPAPAHVALDGTTLTWDGLNRAVCYLVFRDGVLLGQTTETTYTVPSADGTYTVRAANKYGNLSD